VRIELTTQPLRGARSARLSYGTASREGGDRTRKPPAPDAGALPVAPLPCGFRADLRPSGRRGTRTPKADRRRVYGAIPLPDLDRRPASLFGRLRSARDQRDRKESNLRHAGLEAAALPLSYRRKRWRGFRRSGGRSPTEASTGKRSRPDSNRGERDCNPLPCRSATRSQQDHRESN
jgi:hypothetical protein